MKFRNIKTGTILEPRDKWVIEQMQSYPEIYEEVKSEKKLDKMNKEELLEKVAELEIVLETGKDYKNKDLITLITEKMGK